ncbi:hypothetical protein ACP4OV_022444 [Aristida adscensionis]
MAYRYDVAHDHYAHLDTWFDHWASAGAERRTNEDDAGGDGAAAAAAAAPPPSVEDAMEYVQMVKEVFKDAHPDRYRLFLRVMDDFRSQRIAVGEVAAAAAALFRDAPDLVLGFNAFLPKGHKISLVGLDELAACFVRDITLRDDDDDDLYID